MAVERIVEILREEYQDAAKQDRQAAQAIGEILEKYPDTGRPLELSEEDKKERYWHLRDRHVAGGRQQAVGNTIKKINQEFGTDYQKNGLKKSKSQQRKNKNE